MKEIKRIITTQKTTDGESVSVRIFNERYVNGLPVLKDERYSEIDGENKFHVRHTYKYGENGGRSCYERAELDLETGETVENEYNGSIFFDVVDNTDLHSNGSLYGGHNITFYYPESDEIAEVTVRDDYGRIVSRYAKDIYPDDSFDETTEFYDHLGRIIDFYDHDSQRYSHYEYVKRGLNEGRIVKTDYVLVGEDKIPEAVGIEVVGSIVFDLYGNETQIYMKEMTEMTVDYKYDSSGELIMRTKNEVYGETLIVTTEEFFYE